MGSLMSQWATVRDQAPKQFISSIGSSDSASISLDLSPHHGLDKVKGSEQNTSQKSRFLEAKSVTMVWGDTEGYRSELMGWPRYWGTTPRYGPKLIHINVNNGMGV